ncbi:hypothetical protein CYMTET_13756, partial [Cymbomonas tetramitiformis]
LAAACPEFADVVDGVGAPMPGSETPLGGVKVLGIPVGSDQWVADKCVEMAFAAGAVLPKLARLDDPQVWGRMVVLFPAVRDMLPHLGAPEGSEAGEHPLAAGMVAAMGDVCVVDEFGYHYVACNRRGMFTYRHDAIQDVLYEMLRKKYVIYDKTLPGVQRDLGRALLSALPQKYKDMIGKEHENLDGDNIEQPTITITLWW